MEPMRPLGLALALLLAGCALRAPEVRLSATDPAVPAVADPVEPGSLVVAVAGMLSPEAAAPYRRLARALGDALGRPVVVLQRRDYAGVLRLLKNGTAELGFLCTLAAGKGAEEGYLRVLAAGLPQPGAPYRSLLLVRAGQRAKTLADLEGARFAFVDPLSNTGYAWPLRFFRQNGVEPKAFFDQVIFTYSHDRSLRAVAEGFVDAAAVDGMVYHAVLGEHPELKGRIRVLWQSPEDPPPPLVAAKGLGEEEARAVRAALSHLPKAALLPLHIRRFAPADDAPYRAVWRRFLEERRAAP